MKKLIIIIIFLFAITAHAETVSDFISEGYTLKDMEKGFIEVDRNYLIAVVPKGFPRSEVCDEKGENCKQMTWQAYCAGGFLEDKKTDMMIITLDRCGYPNGKNRKYPPTESIINLFLATFGETGVLPKNPGLAKREDYLPEEP